MGSSLQIPHNTPVRSRKSFYALRSFCLSEVSVQPDAHSDRGRHRVLRGVFAQPVILTQEKTLEEALAALESDRKPDRNKLIQTANIPKGTAKTYGEWLKVLLNHYGDLLMSEGSSYTSMVRSVYKNRTNYLLFLNSLGEAEKRFDRAFKPHMDKKTEGVNHIVSQIEACTTKLRREEAAKIFP